MGNCKSRNMMKDMKFFEEELTCSSSTPRTSFSGFSMSEDYKRRWSQHSSSIHYGTSSSDYYPDDRSMGGGCGGMMMNRYISTASTSSSSSSSSSLKDKKKKGLYAVTPDTSSENKKKDEEMKKELNRIMTEPGTKSGLNHWLADSTRDEYDPYIQRRRSYNGSNYGNAHPFYHPSSDIRCNPIHEALKEISQFQHPHQSPPSSLSSTATQLPPPNSTIIKTSPKKSSSSSGSSNSNNNNNNNSLSEQEELIFHLAQTHPDALLDTDPHTGRTPLHILCTKDPTLRLVQTFINLCSVSTMIVDHTGSSPLHIACRYGMSVRCIEVLLDAFPHSLSIVNREGNTPLHEACGVSYVQRSVVKMLIERYPDAVWMRNGGGNTPLHVAVYPLSSRQRLELEEEEKKKKRGVDTEKKKKKKMSNLRQRHISLDVISTLLDPLMSLPGMRIRTYRDIVIGNNGPTSSGPHKCTNAELFDSLLNTPPTDSLPLTPNGSSVNTANNSVLFNGMMFSGNNTTNGAMNSFRNRRGSGNSLSSMNSFGSSGILGGNHLNHNNISPAAVVNNEGNTPLHYMVQNQISEAALALIAEQYPEAVTMRNKDGKTPLSTMYIAFGFDRRHDDQDDTNNQQDQDQIFGSSPTFSSPSHYDDFYYPSESLSPSYRQEIFWKFVTILLKTRRFGNAKGATKERRNNITAHHHHHEPFYLVHELLRLPECPSELARLAMSISPTQLKLPDVDGNLPLHILAARNKRTMGHEDDDTTTTTNKQDDNATTTSSSLKSNTNSTISLRFNNNLIKQQRFPFTSSSSVNTTNTTSTILASSEKEVEYLLRDIVSCYPEATKIPNSDKKLPLEQIMESDKSRHVGLEAVLCANPLAFHNINGQNDKKELDGCLLPYLLECVSGGGGGGKENKCEKEDDHDGAGDGDLNAMFELISSRPDWILS